MAFSPNFVASKAIQQFNKLPKKGKPNVASEWTTMAAIVQEQKIIEGENVKSNLKVISIGTGTKCLGKNELSGLGDVVSDSHAEVIARRSFLLYLYEQIELCKIGRSDKSILQFISCAEDQKVVKNLKLRQQVTFHMFISHLPCGDAAIIDKVDDKEDNTPVDKLSQDTGKSSPPLKKPRTDYSGSTDTNQEHRTGAKLQAGPLQYEEKQITSKCRVKPGKGDPTLCMSCSDKLAKWQILGLQGSFLSLFIEEPLRLETVIIGGGVRYSKESLERALFSRFSDLIANSIKGSAVLDGYKCPQIYQSSENFMKLTEDLNPAPASISWFFSFSVMDQKETVQVLVSGRKQGATKKFFGKPSSMVDICRTKIFSRFKNLYGKSNEAAKTYVVAKGMSERYVEMWGKLKEDVFVGWTEKPKELQLFS